MMRQMATTWLVKRWNHRHVIGVLAILWTSQYPINGYGQSAMLYWLGAPPGGRSVATDVSNTGIVVGYVQTSSGTNYAFYWRMDTGMQIFSNQSGSVAYAVEEGLHGNRFMLVGGASSNVGVLAFSWRSNWSSIQYLNSSPSTAFDIGAKNADPDNRYVVGWARYNDGVPHAKYWVATEQGATAWDFIETIPGRSSYALAIGNMIPRVVGRITDAHGNWRAFYWDGLVNGDRDIYELGTLGGCCSAAEDVSASGLVIVGWAWDANNRVRAFRWQGVMQDLGTLGGNESLAYSVDDSGYIIVGAAKDSRGDFRATMWQQGSIVDLNHVVRDQLSPGSRLIESTAISPYSRYIVGWGYNSDTRRYEAFIIDLVPQIQGDVDGNRCVNDGDLLAVLFAFGNAGGQEDVNHDGVVDDADLLEVLFHFGEGQC